MNPEIAARLEKLNIQWTINEKGFALFHRGDLAVMSSWSNGRFTPGSTGLMTGNGLSYLMWRDGKPVLTAHGGKETPATAEQLENIQRFSTDLKRALELSE